MVGEMQEMSPMMKGLVTIELNTVGKGEVWVLRKKH